GLPIFQQFVAFHIEWAFDPLCSPTSDTIRNSLERLAPIHSVNNGHLPRIARPLRRKRVSAGVQCLHDLFERSNLLTGYRISEINVEVLITVFAFSVRGDGKLSVWRYTVTDGDILIRAILVVRRGQRCGAR